MLDEVEGSRAKGILVDVTGLSKGIPKLFEQVANAVGPSARKDIDPKLYGMGIKKIAFVSPGGNYPRNVIQKLHRLALARSLVGA